MLAQTPPRGLMLVVDVGKILVPAPPLSPAFLRGPGFPRVLTQRQSKATEAGSLGSVRRIRMLPRLATQCPSLKLPNAAAGVPNIDTAFLFNTSKETK